MSGVLGWIRSHVAVVVLLILILVTLPTAFAVSSMWNTRIREARAKEVTNDQTALKALMSYAIPPIRPGEEAITVPAAAPNPSMTEWFREQRRARDAQVKEVVDLAGQLNKAHHEMLVPELLPGVPGTPGEEKRFAFIERLVSPDRPTAYEELFRSINGGPPADSERIAEELEELLQREKDRYKAEHGETTMPRARMEEIAKSLAQYRIGRLQRHATDISVYVTPECLSTDTRVIPRKIPGEAPADWQCFEWQWDLWVMQDLIRSVGEANADGRGGHLPLIRALVKRIDKISVDRLPIEGENTLANEQWEPSGDQVGSKAPLDKRVSVTGRRSSRQNTLYDVRGADLHVVVESAHLTDLINAIGRTNFMTVIGIELAEVDPIKDMQLGYYYGDEHVVRAKLRIETVWLRSWLEPLMPEIIKGAMGIASAQQPIPATAPAAPAAPAARGRPRSPVDEEPATRRGSGRRRDDGGGG